MKTYQDGVQAAETMIQALRRWRWMFALTLLCCVWICTYVIWFTESGAGSDVVKVLTCVLVLFVFIFVVNPVKHGKWTVVFPPENSRSKQRYTFTVYGDLQGFYEWSYGGMLSTRPPKWSDWPVGRVDDGIIQLPRGELSKEAVQGFFDTLPLRTSAK